MTARILTLGFIAGSAFAASAQCSIDLPSDTVTLYWGYDPLACATLTPAVNGAAPSDLLWSNCATTPSITVCDQASSWYYVTLTDDTLCTASDSVFVSVIDVRCGNNNNKVLVCHVPPGNPDNAHTICISENAVPAHLDHGCHLGACAAEQDSSDMGGMIVQVSPNPVSDGSAMLRLHNDNAQRVQVNLVDPMGRRMVRLLDADMASGEERTLDMGLEALPANVSMLWVEVVAESGRTTQRVVLVR